MQSERMSETGCPRVVISSGGVFHAYHMARGAQGAGYLHRFITMIYNRYETDIDRSKIVHIPLPMLVATGFQLLPGTRARAYSYYVGDNLFDRLSRRYVRDADIFHVFNNYGLYAMQAAKARGALTIVERGAAHPLVQAEILTEEYEKLGLIYFYADQRLVDKQVAEYHAADYIMVCSDYIKRTLISKGIPAEKILRVHLGFDPARFRPGKKHDDVFRVMYAGSLHIQKGLHYLLEAFTSLNLPNSELLFVGQPHQDANVFLNKYAGQFRHIKFVPQAELVQHYQQASVFVLPSLQDGFGMVVYEAAACGLPVITTENVGASLRDGQDGFVVPICDARALAEKLEYLYTHPEERATMGQSAYDYVQQFTWANYHQELVGHYQRIWDAQQA